MALGPMEEPADPRDHQHGAGRACQRGDNTGEEYQHDQPESPEVDTAIAVHR